MFKTAPRWILAVLPPVAALVLTVTLLNPPDARQVWAASTPGAGNVITVTTSIQAALDAASPGDTVMIPAGTYTENVTLNKPVSLIAWGPVTIQASGSQRALTIDGIITSNVVISGLTFTGGKLGGVSCPASCGGGLLLRDGASPLIVNSTVRNNMAYQGGGVYADALSDLQLLNVRVLTNTASGNGGGVFANNIFTLSQATLINNTAVNGGGVYHTGSGTGYIVNVLAARNTASTSGAGLTFNSSGAVKIIHATVAGAGLNSQAAIYASNGTVSVTNSIITNHTIGLRQTGGSIVSENYNLFFGNTTDQVGIVSIGANTVYVNPAYIKPLADNFHVAWGSPAIDAGTDAGLSADLDDHPRPIGASVDIGAYEADLPIDSLQLQNNSPQFAQHPVAFTAQVSGGTNVAYVWNFGDGNPPESGGKPVVDHIYRRAGLFTATVTADNNLSRPTVATNTVVISGLLTRLPLILNKYQVYPIQGLTLRGEDLIPLARVITFTASITAGNEVVYGWDFGDGQTLRQANPVVSHAYGLTGIYTVVVSATNGVSGPYTASLKVKVNPSIQTWIDESSPDSLVIVPPGIYQESLVLNKPVSLVAATSLTPTVIMAETGRRALTVVGFSINNSTIISGLTFSNGTLTSTSYPEGCGGGILISGGANPAIRNSTITGNQAYRGGGVCVDADSGLTLLNTNLTRNTAADAGGGIYAEGPLDIQASALITNFAALGGGLYHGGTGDGTIVNTLFARNAAAQLGAVALLNSTGRVSLLHNTIADITLNPRAALEIRSGTVGITNTIITNHAIGIGSTEGVALESYNLFFNTPVTRTGAITGIESRTGDPAFVNVAVDNYHLGKDSLAIDQATPAGIDVDFEGDQRPIGSDSDIGMDEADSAIAGLTLSSTSPVTIGEPVAFTASITAGTNAQYEWNFGDGVVTQTQGSSTVQHSYALWGQFTVVVTALNSLSFPAATSIQVTVTPYINILLPLVLRQWPPVPGAPALNAISNPTGLGSYTVRWTPTGPSAASYILQAAQRSDFTDAVQAYAGAAASFAVTNQGPTRYYYRVKGRNSWGDSGWSNAQFVDVLWEKEPNDIALTQANGAIISGLTYSGALSSAADLQDYFYFDLPAGRTVEVWLANIPAGSDYDLYLRDAALAIVGQSDRDGNEDEYTSTGVLPPGRYYIQIYNRNLTGSAQAYHLRAIYR